MVHALSLISETEIHNSTKNNLNTKDGEWEILGG